MKLKWSSPKTEQDVWWAISRDPTVSGVLIGIGAMLMIAAFSRVMGRDIFESTPGFLAILGAGLLLMGLSWLLISHRNLKKSGDLGKIRDLWSREEEERELEASTDADHSNPSSGL